MTAKEIIEKLYGERTEDVSAESCDCLKAGSPDKEVRKVFVTMFATVGVIRQAMAEGADMIITHEPLYYRHMDDAKSDPVVDAKRELLEKSGITVYRYHDHPHFNKPDIIIEGELRKLKLDGAVIRTDRFGITDIVLNEPKTAAEIAEICRKNLHTDCVRIAGATDIKANMVTFTPGAIGDAVMKELRRPDSQIVICGETCEWAICEFARDAAILGMNKALIPLGHAVSERDGMEYTAEILSEMLPGLSVSYIDCGDVFAYSCD